MRRFYKVLIMNVVRRIDRHFTSEHKESLESVPFWITSYYRHVINFVLKMGDSIAPRAGKSPDIGGEGGKWMVTLEDLKCERDFVQLVSTFEGDHRVWAEEENFRYPEDCENVWIVDPISGTFSFVNGLPHFAVAATHLYKGEPHFAVIYDPTMKELFIARKGCGAFMRSMQNNQFQGFHLGSPIAVERNQKDTRYKVLIFEYVTAHWILKERYLELHARLIETAWIKSYGAFAVHYAYVACGRAHATVSMNFDTYPEYAAKLIVEEAGGRITDFQGDPLQPNSKGIIVSNGSEYHDQLLEIFHEYQY